jgi:hypothetical protein
MTPIDGDGLKVRSHTYKLIAAQQIVHNTVLQIPKPVIAQSCTHVSSGMMDMFQGHL